jgi:N-acetyl-anhydromuramyl-L-alanine amidase AmpD
MHGLANFTEAQYSSLRDLCEQINEAYAGKIRFRGHKEIDPNRTCPVYDYKKILDLDDEGYMDL